MQIEDSDDPFPKEWDPVECHQFLPTQTAAATTTTVLELSVLE
jgi:hypothetical protein